jgi:hypothetical protein
MRDLIAGRVANAQVVGAGSPGVTLSAAMPPPWIWVQVAIVVFVLAGMIIAITKLA